MLTIKEEMKIKTATLFFLCTMLLASCSQKKTGQHVVADIDSAKTWLGQDVDSEQINDIINTYHINDSTGSKVGSMIFSLAKNGNMLIAKDTSQFDDGRVYETAILKVDLEEMTLRGLDMDIKVPNADVFIDLVPSKKKIVGKLRVNRDSTVMVDRKIDSTYTYEAFREEIYMLLHTIQLGPGDRIPFKMFFPNDLSVVNSSLSFEKEEIIEVPAGKFKTTVVYLDTGGLLDNRIWISKENNKKLVKFSVPKAKLNIELVSSKSL
ncbi:MAG: hypothetical protein AAFZ89_16385 [Bacteroidota bacterium]